MHHEVGSHHQTEQSVGQSLVATFTYSFHHFSIAASPFILNKMPAFLELAHVNVARGNNVVLHDINLAVNTGEHIAILGPNGCGKSTLIKTITCECYPLVQAGMKVSIFGRERWDLTELKKRLGVV